MKEIRLRNLRGLSDTGFISLKPLNLLVGKNSSGKSTFLRFFPLMKQSFESRTSSPILWFGRYVDFGTFKEAFNINAENDSISLEFKLEISSTSGGDYIRYRLRESLNFIGILDTRVKIEFKGDSLKELTEVKSVEIEFGGQKVNVDFDNNEVTKCTVNGLNVLRADPSLITRHYDGLLPHLYFAPSKQKERTDFGVGRSSTILLNRMVKKIDKYFHYNTSDRRKIITAFRVPIGSTRSVERAMQDIYESPYWKKQIKKITHKEIDEIVNLRIAYALPGFFQILNNEIEGYFSSTQYIAPLRSQAERYYRPQSLAVDEVDPQGSNLVLFLRSLSETNKIKLREWTKENLGFTVKVSSSGGHISLKLKEEGMKGNEFNIADMGFGFSQILPIVIQLWTQLEGIDRGNTRINRINKYRDREAHIVFAIEQPELHLHPALQARLIDVFIKIILAFKENNIKCHFILETHSETMINRVGQNIIANPELRKKMGSGWAQVLLFEKKNTTHIIKSKYNAKGYLEDWPYGFFEPKEV